MTDDRNNTIQDVNIKIPMVHRLGYRPAAFAESLRFDIYTLSFAFLRSVILTAYLK